MSYSMAFWWRLEGQKRISANGERETRKAIQDFYIVLCKEQDKTKEKTDVSGSAVLSRGIRVCGIIRFSFNPLIPLFNNPNILIWLLPVYLQNQARSWIKSHQADFMRRSLCKTIKSNIFFKRSQLPLCPSFFWNLHFPQPLLPRPSYHVIPCPLCRRASGAGSFSGQGWVGVWRR